MSQPLIGGSGRDHHVDYATFDTSRAAPSSSSMRGPPTRVLASSRQVDQPTHQQLPSLANTSTYHQTSQIVNPGDLLKSRSVILLCLSLFLGYCVIGVSFYTYVEGWTVLDSAYFCVVTITTVGFGDLVPQEPSAKLFTALFELLGIGIAGSALGILGNQMLESQQARFVETLHKSEPSTALASPAFGDPEARKSFRSSRAKIKPVASLLALVFLMILGSFGFSHLEGFPLSDSFYMCCSTITTVGYGDISPRTPPGRLFAIVWILSGTFVLAKTFSDVLNYFIESRQRALARQILQYTLSHEEGIATMDVDADGRVTESEYVATMLVKLGYVSDDKVNWLRQSFQRADKNGDGVLTWDELKDAAPSRSPSRGVFAPDAATAASRSQPTLSINNAESRS